MPILQSSFQIQHTPDNGHFLVFNGVKVDSCAQRQPGAVCRTPPHSMYSGVCRTLHLFPDFLACHGINGKSVISLLPEIVRNYGIAVKGIGRIPVKNYLDK